MKTNQLSEVLRAGTLPVAARKLDQAFEKLTLQAVHCHVDDHLPCRSSEGVVSDFVIAVLVDAVLDPLDPLLLAMLPLNKRMQPTVGKLTDEVREELHKRRQAFVVVEEILARIFNLMFDIPTFQRP